MEIRTLSQGDEGALEGFLARHTASSMFLRGNSFAAGLVDRGAPLEGTYVAAVDDGTIVAVAALFWNGILVLQAPEPRALESVARAALSRAGRKLKGLAGPLGQVEAVRASLGLAAPATSHHSREKLYELDLSDLEVPRGLADGRLVCRAPHPEELDFLTGWRVDYCVETLGMRASPELAATSRVEIGRLQRDGSQWILLDRDRAVSYSAFNARVPDAVQVGGVWTPRELRGRGYGRAVVAGSLLDARREGVRTAVLFTDEENRPARAAYEALGFRVVGDYALVIFE
jgi:ribosomal protein S18 acetylase RimI-like enzyme